MGHPIRSFEDIKKTIGLSLKETYTKLTSDNDVDRAKVFARLFKEKADQVMVANTELYNGVKERLTDLKENGYKIAIVTTKFHYRIDQILHKFEAEDLIDVIVGAEDVKEEKPCPEGLLQAIKLLSINSDDALYVGDSIVDAKTAENAQIAFAAVLTGATTREAFACYDNVFIGNNITEICNYFESYQKII